MRSKWIDSPGQIVLGFMLLSASAGAQPYLISTYAGGSPPPTPAVGLDMPIGYPEGLAADADGNLYFTSYNSVFRLDRNGVVTRVAGNSRAGYSGDGGPATEAQLTPTALAVDAGGSLFIVDGWRIRKVSPDGIISTVVGNGRPSFASPPPVSSGDGGPATSAQLYSPRGLAVDLAGNLFIADGDRVREVSPDGIITTVAGAGTLSGSSADGSAATSAQLVYPSSVAVDSAGNLFIADTYSRRIRKVSPDGIITTVAGNGTVSKVCVAGSSANGGPANAAQLCSPSNIAFDPAGNLLITDSGFTDDSDGGYYTNFAVLKLFPDGSLTVVSGTDALGLYGGNAIAVDNAGNLFIAERYNHRISMFSPDGIRTTVAGNSQCCYYHFDDAVPATSAQLNQPASVAVDGAGNLFITEYNRIRRVSPDGIITGVAGAGPCGYGGDGGPAMSAQLSCDLTLAADRSGNLFIADRGNHRIRKISTDGTISTVAGNGTSGDSGDGGPAVSAQFGYAASIAVDRAGNLFITDRVAFRIRRVSPDGIITTVAGNGIDGFSGDGGPAASAELEPISIAVDDAGNLFISDTSAYRIRKVSPAGIITSIAGSGAICWVGDYSGDAGPATSANCVNGSLAVDREGNLFTTAAVSRIRKITPGGIITTVAGTFGQGYSGDGGLATDAQLNLASSTYVSVIAVDGSGNIYIADSGNNAVRILRPVTPR